MWLRHTFRYTFDFGLPDKSGTLFNELNVDLRRMSTASTEEHYLKTIWKAFMRNMTNALHKLPKIQENTLYRGMPHPYLELRSIYEGGREVVWTGFTSVYKSLDQAACLAGWDRGCVLDLKIFDVCDISNFRFNADQPEGLVLPNSKFVVLSDTHQETLKVSNGQDVVINFIGLQQMNS
jgi:hypothetical protein